jgi:hypothetical protein
LKEALGILSDLITLQATEVDLSLIILRAAVVLKHMDINERAIEYLEYIVDEPPTADGYTKIHTQALLTLIYEQSGDQFRVVLEKAYEDLFQLYITELKAGKRPMSNQKKVDEMLFEKSFAKSSEVWVSAVYGAFSLKQFLAPC